MITSEDFFKLDIRVGTIIEVEEFVGAKKKAYKIKVDFGNNIGIKKTSAQLTENYQVEDLVGRQIIGVINLPTKQIANYISEFLILGVYSKNGVVLLSVDRNVSNGDKIG